MDKEKIYNEMRIMLKDAIAHLEKATQNDCVDDIFITLARDEINELVFMFEKVAAEIKCADG